MTKGIFRQNKLDAQIPFQDQNIQQLYAPTKIITIIAIAIKAPLKRCFNMVLTGLVSFCFLL